MKIIEIFEKFFEELLLPREEYKRKLNRRLDIIHLISIEGEKMISSKRATDRSRGITILRLANLLMKELF
jgi:hypothetical protein